MGSAAAFHLASRGQRILGLDRFQPPHQFGSSHGLTRIIREAYFEHPLYVPLVQRAYELWDALEKVSGRKLFVQTGGLMIGPADGPLVSGARRSALEHNLSHQILSSKELAQRFPVFKTSPETVAVLEPRAGVLFPELAIQVHLELAAAGGAQFNFDSAVIRWEPTAVGVRVHTANRSLSAKKLLLSAGSWLPSLVPDLHLPLQVERQVLFWFEPLAGAASAFNPGACPIYIWEYEPRRFFYGFPNLGDGVKIGMHHEGASVQPDNLDRKVKAEEIEAARQLLERFLPSAAGALKSSAVCMYTNTPDEHFLLDFHPNHPQVLIASPCSGHGFKFSPVIGELSAALLSGEKPNFDLSLFRVNRFERLR